MSNSSPGPPSTDSGAKPGTRAGLPKRMIAPTQGGFDVLSLDFEGWRPLADTGLCIPHLPGKTAVTRLTLTVDEAAAQMFGLSRAAAYRCVKRGELGGYSSAATSSSRSPQSTSYCTRRRPCRRHQRS